jgi:hypothetical protein
MRPVREGRAPLCVEFATAATHIQVASRPLENDARSRIPRKKFGRSFRRCFERALRLQAAGMARTARSRPPSPEVMPQGTVGDTLAKLLALRCAGDAGGHRTVLAALSPCAAGRSGGREHAVCFQAAGVVVRWAHSMPESPGRCHALPDSHAVARCRGPAAESTYRRGNKSS